jgi:hypothetical protein
MHVAPGLNSLCLPSCVSSLPGDLPATFFRQSIGSRLATFSPKGNGGWILSLRLGCRHILGNLAGRDPHDVYGVADHVAGATLTFGASRHRYTFLIDTAWR